MKEFLNVDDLSEYLSIKKSTVYSLAESGDLPCFKIGRLIRFRRDEVETWIEEHRKETANPEIKARDVLRGIKDRRIDVEKIVQKSKEAVEAERGSRYNLTNGRPDQVKGLGKEVEHGSL